MSDFRAIATVTATITFLLRGIQNDVPGTLVTAKPPDVVVGGAPSTGLNVFLYQVNLNMGYRNQDQPARNSSGDLVKRPRLGLNLHYLITATAEGDHDPLAHKILASGMRILHENPVLTSSLIDGAIGAHAELTGSDLGDQIEQVKIAPLVLSLDEITKLWSSFFQTNYRISAAYEVTVILLDSELSPKPSLRVKTPQISALPFSVPIIQSIDPQVLQYSPTAPLTISGLNLTGNGQFQTSVLIDGTPVSFDPTKATSTTISLIVPPTVTPGIKSVQVVMGVIPPSGPPALPGFKSNVVPFVLAPNITGGPNFTVVQGAALTLAFTPDVGPGQQVDFLIGDYTVSLPQNAPITAPLGQITLTIPSSIPVNPANPYLLRIRVDGAESLLQPAQPGTAGTYVSPTLTVTT